MSEQRGIGGNPGARQELERLVRSGKTEQRIALGARIILGAADGKSNNALARELNTSRPTVIDWRRRFAEGGVEALDDDHPRGRSFPPLARAKTAEIITRTQSPPPHVTQWSCSRMAKACGVSKASVQRVWHANGLKPHLLKTFKLSNDPDFIEKLEDVVGLYMNPPDHALVFCIDEKCQIQRCYGASGEGVAPSSLQTNRRGCPMPQVNDLSRCLAALDQDSTLIAVIEMSQSSWLVAGIVPGIARHPMKKLEPDKAALLQLLHRWRAEAERSGRKISRIAVAFEAGRDGVWLAPLAAGARHRRPGDPSQQHRGLARASPGKDRPARYRPVEAGLSRLAAR